MASTHEPDDGMLWGEIDAMGLDPQDFSTKKTKKRLQKSHPDWKLNNARVRSALQVVLEGDLENVQSKFAVDVNFVSVFSEISTRVRRSANICAEAKRALRVPEGAEDFEAFLGSYQLDENTTFEVVCPLGLGLR